MMRLNNQPENMFSVLDILRKLRKTGYLDESAAGFSSLMDIISSLGIGDILERRGYRSNSGDNGARRRGMHSSSNESMSAWPTEGTRW